MLIERLIGPGGPFELQQIASGDQRFARPPHSLPDVYRRAERGNSRTLLLQGERSWTYSEVFSRAGVFSAWLRERGLGQARIGLTVDDGAEWITWFVAITDAGASCVMPPPGASPDMVKACLEQAGCALVIDTGGEAAEAAIGGPRATMGDGDAGGQAEPDDEALIAFTSGSSGTPKGVVHTHRSLLSGLRNMMLGGAMAGQLGSATPKPPSSTRPPLPATLVLAPLGYIAGFSSLLLTLMGGGKLVMTHDREPARLAALISEQGVQSIAGGSTELLDQLIDLPGSPGLLSSLRRVQLHGEGLQKRLVRKFADKAPHADVHTSYGLTETAGSIACAPAERVLDTLGKCGPPLPSVRLRIVDTSSQVLEAGEVGQVEVRGDMLMRGYLDASLNARIFTADGWFRTGDLGSLDTEGWLQIFDRSQLQGAPPISLSPLAIEERLRDFASVQDAAAAPTRDGIALFIQPKPGEIFDRHAAMSAIEADYDSRYSIHIEIIERLPRTASGKVDRAVLTARGNELSAQGTKG